MKIIYLDNGIGKFSVRYDSSSNPDKTAVTITKTNSGNWVTKSIAIADGAFDNKGPKNSDFSLVNEDNEDEDTDGSGSSSSEVTAAYSEVTAA